MKRIALVLVFVSLPCLAQEKPRAGFIGDKDCRAYFVANSYFVPDFSVVPGMTEAEKEYWRKKGIVQGLSKEEENWWAKKQHKKYPGLCYIPPGYFDNPQHLRLPDQSPLPLLYDLWLIESRSFHTENSTATQTSTRDVPVEGQTTVTDNRGQTVGTATTTGTVRVETTTTYPVSFTVLDTSDRSEVWRVNYDGSSAMLYSKRRSNSLGRGGLAELFQVYDPRAKALDDGLKFLRTEAGLEKKKK